MNAVLRSSGRRGQALVEMTVALVVIVVLLAALLQIGRLTRERQDALNAARGDAARFAMSDVYTLQPPPPRYLRDWEVGPDGVRHSRDDVARLGNPAGVRLGIAAKALPDELARRLPANAVSALATRVPTIDEFYLVHGRAESRPIELLPVVRHLLYDAESIVIEENAFLVWTQGIY